MRMSCSGGLTSLAFDSNRCVNLGLCFTARPRGGPTATGFRYLGPPNPQGQRTIKPLSTKDFL